MTDRDAPVRPSRHPALHDPLTGLANEALFTDRARQALARCSRSGGALTVILIALDDTGSGHESPARQVDDSVLVAAAHSLESALRAEDTVARLDDRELVVLVEGVESLDRARMLAERLRGALRRGIDPSDTVRSNVGVAMGMASDVDVEDLLRDADTALCAARASEQDSVEMFASAMHEHAHERFRLQADLRRALERSELVLFYRPTVEPSDGRLQGFEAVPCWSHPSLGLVPAERLIPLAEETGLIVPIGRWILSEAIRQIGVWDALHATAANLTIAVNVSPLQLAAPGLTSDVRALLEHSGIEPARVLLQTTESPLANDADPLVEVFAQLSDLGLRTTLDERQENRAADPSPQSKPIPAEVAEGLLSGDILPASNAAARNAPSRLDPPWLHTPESGG
jgi:diguanylate cyclase (GGDEF)-like protein